MAGIVKRQFSYQVLATRSGTPVAGGKVVGFNAADALIINETLNTNGRFGTGTTDTPINVEAQEYSVTATDTVATTDRNPYDIRYLTYPDSIITFGKSFSVASVDSFFAATDPVITQTNKTTVNGYTGITFTHGSDLITLSGGTWDRDRLYDRAQAEAIDNPQATPAAFIESVDGLNFTQNYDLLLQTITFDGNQASYSGDWEVNTSGTLTDIRVENLLLDDGTGTVQTTVNDITVNNTLTFAVAGTYSFTTVTVTLDLVNTSGGAVTINAVTSSLPGTPTGPNITINQSVPITITVQDAVTGSPIENAAVFLEETPGGTDVISYDRTNASGQVTTTYNYTSDQAVKGFVSKGTNLPVYKRAGINDTIRSTGLSATVPMTADSEDN